MKEFAVKAAQTGFAAGEVFAADEAPETAASARPEGKRTPEEEQARYEEAADALDRELASSADGADRDSAEIYEAERLLLKDETYTESVLMLIREEGLDASSAAEKAGGWLEQQMGDSGNDYIHQRKDDLRGVTERLRGILGGKAVTGPERPSILVAEELSPARLSAVDPAMILGILTEKGAPTSHVSILAGNLGVPCVYGSQAAAKAARRSGRVILDGEKVIADPGEEQYRAALGRMEREREKKRWEQKEKAAFPAGSTRTAVVANIAGPRDIPELIASGAEGVGLFRSEFLFLDKDAAPSEEEQFEAYRSVALAMEGKETVIRTLDAGSDKEIRWLPQPAEKNPALGCRGLRLCLREKDLFRTQLRALLRAAALGNIKIMLPMVTSVREVEAVRRLTEACAAELAREGREYAVPPLGIMVETPAAAMIADELAEIADFFSIGTNDLTQYTLALDREAQGLDDYYDPCHDAVFRLIERTAAAGHRKNIPTCVCGELAANPGAIGRLIECGVDKLSVSLPKIGETRRYAAEAEKQLPPGRKTEPAEPSAEPAVQARSASIAAPADGRLIPMEQIPDPVFSSGTMGPCIGIMPENGTIHAPCNGVVSGIAPTGHAMTFTASDGKEILVHVGIDTVRLGGKGFRVLVREGSAVARDEAVMEADLDVIREAGLSPLVIVACP